MFAFLWVVVYAAAVSTVDFRRPPSGSLDATVYIFGFDVDLCQHSNLFTMQNLDCTIGPECKTKFA